MGQETGDRQAASCPCLPAPAPSPPPACLPPAFPVLFLLKSLAAKGKVMRQGEENVQVTIPNPLRGGSVRPVRMPIELSFYAQGSRRQ